MTISDGFILIDKPAGMTSFNVLRQVQRKWGFKKTGHTGTLDPFATGLLVVGVGEALKFIPYLNEEPKKYAAALKLGVATDTQDLTGTPTGEGKVPELSGASITAAMHSLTGTIQQIPPMYSAKKKDGKKLYELARAGKKIERPPVLITIHDLSLTAYTGGEVRFEVACSKGTYVRTLGVQLAEKLGTVGHLIALRRLASGPFTVANAMTLKEAQIPDGHWIPLDQALGHWPEYQCSEGTALALRQGKSIPESGPGGFIRLQLDGEFIGIGERVDPWIYPRRMMRN